MNWYYFYGHKKLCVIIFCIFISFLFTYFCIAYFIDNIRVNELEKTKSLGNMVVIAINSYHKANGKYPMGLEFLVPEYINRLPQPTFGLGKWQYRIGRWNKPDNSLFSTKIIDAIEKYYQTNGQYPYNLEILVPKYIKKVPQQVYGLEKYQASLSKINDIEFELSVAANANGHPCLFYNSKNSYWHYDK